MYVTTSEGVRQAPTPSNSFAGTLGKNSLPPETQKFLKQVRNQPHTYKRLLLTVTFHPSPIYSDLDVTIGRYPLKLLDYVMTNNITAVELLDELRRISNTFHKTDKNFRRQIEAELKLRNTMFKTTGRLVRDELLRTSGNLVPQKLKPFLLDALLSGNTPLERSWQGLSFTQKMLPPSLAKRIMKSDASEAHLTYLGMLLRRYAEELGKKDAAFEQLVEQERKKRLAPKKQKP